MNQSTIHLLNSWAQQLTNAIVKVSPVVWQTALAAKQADCIGGIVTLVIAGAISLGLAVWLGRRFSYFMSEYNEGMSFATGAGTVVMTLSTLLILFFGLLNQWLWIGAFNPSLAVAHDIIQKVLGS